MVERGSVEPVFRDLRYLSGGGVDECRNPRILFERYDGGAPNQRVHIDVNAVGPRVETPEERNERLEQERARLEELGATFKREATGMAGETWIEMFDPEGNWFCVQ